MNCSKFTIVARLGILLNSLFLLKFALPLVLLVCCWCSVYSLNGGKKQGWLHLALALWLKGGGVDDSFPTLNNGRVGHAELRIILVPRPEFRSTRSSGGGLAATASQHKLCRLRGRERVWSSSVGSNGAGDVSAIPLFCPNRFGRRLRACALIGDMLLWRTSDYPQVEPYCLWHTWEDMMEYNTVMSIEGLPEEAWDPQAGRKHHISWP